MSWGKSEFLTYFYTHNTLNFSFFHSKWFSQYITIVWNEMRLKITFVFLIASIITSVLSGKSRKHHLQSTFDYTSAIYRVFMKQVFFYSGNSGDTANSGDSDFISTLYKSFDLSNSDMDVGHTLASFTWYLKRFYILSFEICNIHWI